MVKRKVVEETLRKYKEAWINRDPDRILEIFTGDARYHERVLEKPFMRHAGIRDYWMRKVVGEQEKIRFRLLNLYIEKNTAIAEWEAWFHDRKRNASIHMKEVAILEFRRNKIRSLREYWSSEKG
jgi:nuclear transport factor 2 (NTF2) superfamily protein